MSLVHRDLNRVIATVVMTLDKRWMVLNWLTQPAFAGVSFDTCEDAMRGTFDLIIRRSVEADG